LGMDRSGTSLCASVLHALGVSLGPNLLSADQFNERGYFEDREIWEVHERILAILGRSWDTLATVRPFPPGWFDSEAIAPLEAELAGIVRNRTTAAGSGVWGFKDPRTVLVLPLWKRVFRDLGIDPRYVVCVRHPGAVAQSLAARDKFPARFSEMLWFEKTLAACEASCDSRSCLIHFEEWFSRPAACAERLLGVTGLRPSAGTAQRCVQAAIAKVIPEMRHDSVDSPRIESSAAEALYHTLARSSRVPDGEVLRKFRTGLDVAANFVAAVEQIAGFTLPASADPPSYSLVTDQDLGLSLTEAEAGIKMAWPHDPVLVRLQRKLASHEKGLAEYAKAYAGLESLARELQDQIRRYDEVLAHAQQLVAQRDAELAEYAKALAQAQQFVAERSASQAHGE